MRERGEKSVINSAEHCFKSSHRRPPYFEELYLVSQIQIRIHIYARMYLEKKIEIYKGPNLAIRFSFVKKSTKKQP